MRLRRLTIQPQSLPTLFATSPSETEQSCRQTHYALCIFTFALSDSFILIDLRRFIHGTQLTFLQKLAEFIQNNFMSRTIMLYMIRFYL